MLGLYLTRSLTSCLSKGTWVFVWRKEFKTRSGREGYEGVIIPRPSQWRELGSVSNFKTHLYFQCQSSRVPSFVYLKKGKPTSPILRHLLPFFSIYLLILCSDLTCIVVFQLFMHTTIKTKLLTRAQRFSVLLFACSLRVHSPNTVFKSYLEEFSLHPLFSVVILFI